ncbi:MAG: hypothetical protein NTW29_01770 [Bacteroidetes bacterium]|nr:hypothetical protein [Bacteroidota bacterium]
MERQIYYRLIALWVLSEAMLGGIIHGFNLPVSGLVVGTCAVACISLLAWYVPERGAILKATIIVAVFKMMLSPQAPPPAYIAVFFQGVLGEFLFRKDKRFYRITCVVFATIALLESGIQRILVLTLIYGNDIWVVINDFINRLTRQKVAANYSLIIGAVYVSIHVLVGILVGTWIAGLPARVEKWQADHQNILLVNEGKSLDLQRPVASRNRRRVWIFLIWIFLVALYIQSYYKIGTPLLPSHISLKIFLRSLIIVLSWVFLVSPLLKKLLYGWLQRKQSQSAQDIQQVLNILPITQQLVVKSWRQARDFRGWSKIQHWLKLVLANALSSHSGLAEGVVVLFVAPIQTGKTTSLVEWSADRQDVYGILTPVVDGRRMFMDAHTRQLFLMEAKEGDEDTVAVGKYHFSRANFEKASQVIRQSANQKGWLVIDEIGPLELNGEGFCTVLKELIQEGRKQMILVVREKDKMPERVKNYFGLHHALVINHAGAL